MTAELFRDDPNVRVLAGDWRESLPSEAPFDLLFFGAAKHSRPAEDADAVIGLLAPGGLAVIDDLTPPVREIWLAHPGVAAVELLTTAQDAVILAVRP